MNILIATKETSKEYLEREHGHKHILTLPENVRKENLKTYYEYYNNLGKLVSSLNKKGLKIDIKSRVNTLNFSAYGLNDFLNADIVLSFGGDGEVIDVARNINKNIFGEKPPLVWTERADNNSYGALTSATNLSYDEKIEKIIEKEYEVSEWARAKGIIWQNGRIIEEDLALNEIAFVDKYSMGSMRYVIRSPQGTEYQRCGGGIVSTNVGLQGWLLHIPSWNMELMKEDAIRLKEKNFDFEDKTLEFRIRENRQMDNYKLTNGKIKRWERIFIDSQMSYDGVVTFDASKPHYKNSRCYDFNVGRTLEIRTSDDSLNVIKF